MGGNKARKRRFEHRFAKSEFQAIFPNVKSPNEATLFVGLCMYLRKNRRRLGEKYVDDFHLFAFCAFSPKQNWNPKVEKKTFDIPALFLQFTLDKYYKILQLFSFLHNTFKMTDFSETVSEARRQQYFYCIVHVLYFFT